MASIPSEFFTPEELSAVLDTPQPKRQRELLAKQGVPFVIAASGLPRVYRNKLLPKEQITTVEVFDFQALASGKTKKAA